MIDTSWLWVVFTLLAAGGQTVRNAMQRELIHGYYAATSYADAQIGKVLDALEANGLDKNTIIVLWGDHGWHLGDHGIWGKWTNFECALRSPLIVRVPGQPEPGQPADGIVETIDIYPTLAALCDLQPPKELHGQNIEPLIQHAAAPGKPAAFRRLTVSTRRRRSPIANARPSLG